MIEMECEICGETASFDNKEEAIEAGWSRNKIRKPVNTTQDFCPDESSKDIANEITEVVQ